MTVALYRKADDSRTDRYVHVGGNPPSWLYFQDDPVPYRRILRQGASRQAKVAFTTRPMSDADAEALAPGVAVAALTGPHPDYYTSGLTSAEVQALARHMLVAVPQLLGVPA